MPEYVPVMQAAELTEGVMSTVDAKGVHVLLARVDGEVYAVSGTCTHQEADLGLGFLIEDRVVCPLHLSQFGLKDGAVQNSPATTPLRTFNVKIEGGTIFVEI
jgi:naphthalene 1,2-dioxygenase system ferredoxin subunit